MLSRRHRWRPIGLVLAGAFLTLTQPVVAVPVPALGTDHVSDLEIEVGTDSRVEEPSRYGRLEDLRFRDGDDPAWAAVDYDDSEWRTGRFDDLPAGPEPRWLRATVDLPRTSRTGAPFGVIIEALENHEAFWDGVAIGSNGPVSEVAASETPGLIRSVYALPPELATPGRHVLAIRSSSWHVGFEARQSRYLLAVGDYRDYIELPLEWSIPALVCLGGLLLAGLYFLVLFALDRKEIPHLLIGLLSLAVAAQLVAEIWRPLLNYPYDLHVARLRAVAVLAWLTGALLMAFHVFRFSVPYRAIVLTCGLAASASCYWIGRSFDERTASILLVSLLFCLGIGLYALRKRERGSLPSALGVSVSLVFFYLEPELFLDLSWFLSIILLLAFLFASHAMKLRQQRKEHEIALTRSMRLELELVKRHLNPHFLMNTLTTFSEIIEQEPEHAGSALDSLAAELRTLQEIASERSIPLARELDLCRAHLEVMGFRTDRRFVLDSAGVEPDRELPPAILHTLLENALTHNRYESDEVTFELRQRLEGDRIHYRFRAPLDPRQVEALSSGSGPNESAPNAGRSTDTTTPHQDEHGSGLKYIETRLTESFGSDWSVSHRISDGCWQTDLRFPPSVS